MTPESELHLGGRDKRREEKGEDNKREGKNNRKKMTATKVRNPVRVFLLRPPSTKTRYIVCFVQKTINSTLTAIIPSGRKTAALEPHPPSVAVVRVHTAVSQMVATRTAFFFWTPWSYGRSQYTSYYMSSLIWGETAQPAKKQCVVVSLVAPNPQPKRCYRTPPQPNPSQPYTNRGGLL